MRERFLERNTVLRGQSRREGLRNFANRIDWPTERKQQHLHRSVLSSSIFQQDVCLPDRLPRRYSFIADQWRDYLVAAEELHIFIQSKSIRKGKYVQRLNFIQLYKRLFLVLWIGHFREGNSSEKRGRKFRLVLLNSKNKLSDYFGGFTSNNWEKKSQNALWNSS